MNIYPNILYNVIFDETDNGIEYGLVCSVKGKDKAVIRKISPNYYAVREQAELYTVAGLSPIHFFDAVEDYITG